jgi:hypothetical protein
LKPNGTGSTSGPILNSASFIAASRFFAAAC